MTQSFGYKHQPSLLSPFLHMLTILKKQVKAQTYCRASQSLPLRESGIKGEPSHIHMVSVIASKQGIDYVKSKLPHDRVTLWVGAIDPELTPKSYIVPGLGDAGDLAFGEKIDSKEEPIGASHF